MTNYKHVRFGSRVMFADSDFDPKGFYLRCSYGFNLENVFQSAPVRKNQSSNSKSSDSETSKKLDKFHRPTVTDHLSHFRSVTVMTV